MKSRVLTLLVLAMLLVTVAPVSFAAPPIGKDTRQGDSEFRSPIDDRPDPLTLRQRDLRQKALAAKLKGKAYGRTHEVARGQFVELAREGEGAIWTVLGEFADFPHNNIAQPDRTVNNTTIWVPDFSRTYYMDLLFNDAPGVNSMRNFYIEQSSNRYTVHGDVTDWIPVPGVACDYDDGDPGPGDALHVWKFLKDTVNGWYDAQIAAGKSPAEIDAYLSKFDVWDRYDYDGDGDFDEPDGYIDTIQFVHSGEGNEAVGGALGDCAIWSHSWYAYINLIGFDGPDFNKAGGIRIGYSNYWVGKYTIQPENGGMGVFAHEFGHDLGLPDLYDTSIPIQVGDNSTGFWTLMSTGNWLSDGTVDVGSKPSHMGAWEKFNLGWLNYEVAFAGQKSEHKLGPMETNTKQAQGLFVILPKKEVVTQIGTPYAGSCFYYSDSGDNLDNLMYKSFALPTAGATLTAKVNYEIELDWDYAYLTVNGAPIATNLSTNTNPHGQNIGQGITGSSGGWVDLTADLSAYAGQTVRLGFRYWTDEAFAGSGFMVDEININGFPTDGAEADAGWTFTGFRVSTGTESALFNHYYVAEFRQYRGYDDSLRFAYNFGFLDDPEKWNYVERFPYQDGLLINYWDTSQKDNNTAVHPGKGLLLPIDAHPEVMHCANGDIWHNRMQTYDSTFSLEPTEAITLHWNSQSSYHPSQPAVPVFDDRFHYYRSENPWGSVMHPNTGTQIRIKSVSALGGFMQVEVGPAK